jgi:hypothetical protein
MDTGKNITLGNLCTSTEKEDCMEAEDGLSTRPQRVVA